MTFAVLRARGWIFPPLAKLRAKWIERFPNRRCRNPSITKWQQEDDNEVDLGEGKALFFAPNGSWYSGPLGGKGPS